jgi:hypothetical protein
MPQVRLDFEKLTEAGLKPVVRKIEKHGLTVASIKATNKAKRMSGYLTKSVIFVFDTGQQLEVLVKADGTVFQVKLNRKVVPIKAVSNIDKAIVELVDAVQDNERKYLKAKKRREAQVAKKLATGSPARITRKEKLDKAKAMQSELQSELAVYQERMQSLDLADLQARLEDKKAEEALLQEKNTELKSELEGLKKEAV